MVGFQEHGLHFFSFLLPEGAPLALAPLLVVLELVSYCFRAVSLGVRLFANMMAGHTLVKILSGLHHFSQLHALELQRTIRTETVFKDSLRLAPLLPFVNAIVTRV